MNKKRRAPAFPVLAVLLVASACLPGCSSSVSTGGTAPERQAEEAAPGRSSRAEDMRPEIESFGDIPTAYPNLYCHDAESGWLNVYDESKVINYADAGRYIGQDVTVEGVPSSVVYAGSSSGSPYFINMGDGAFAAVIWSQNLAQFDQIVLNNYVEWSKSDQPITSTVRVSGTVELYDGRPQIVAKDGSQVADLMSDGRWMTMMSDEAVTALMDKRYR